MKKKVTKKVSTKKAVKKNHPYEVGQNYLIRTVTNYFTGKLVDVFEQELVLADAAWIADTGRFYDAIKDGTLSEVEPIVSGNVIIGRGAIIDCVKWVHLLPYKNNEPSLFTVRL